jgi:hypothetical protein
MFKTTDLHNKSKDHEKLRDLITERETSLYGNLSENLNLLAELTDDPVIAHALKDKGATLLTKMSESKVKEEYLIYEKGLTELLKSIDLFDLKNNPENLNVKSLSVPFDYKTIKINSLLTVFENLANQISSEFSLSEVQTKQTLLENIVVQIAGLKKGLESIHLSAIELQKINDLEQALLNIFNAETPARFDQEKILFQSIYLEFINQYAPMSLLRNTQMHYLTTLMQQNMSLFQETRLSYLKNISSKATIARDALWITAGVGLITASLAVPGSSSVALALGAVTAGYGIMDSAREINEQVMEHHHENLLKKTENTSPQPSVSFFKKIPKIIGSMSVGISMVLGIAGLFSFAFPPAAPFIMGAVALTATLVVGGLYIRKRVKERQTLNKALDFQQSLLQENERNALPPIERLILTEEELEKKTPPHFDSTLLIETALHDGNTTLAHKSLETIHENLNKEIFLEQHPVTETKIFSEKEIKTENHKKSEEEDDNEGEGSTEQEPFRHP